MDKLRWPETVDQLIAAGYAATAESRKCRGRTCDATIELWLDKRKHAILMHRLSNGKLQPHWIDCPDRPIRVD